MAGVGRVRPRTESFFSIDPAIIALRSLGMARILGQLDPWPIAGRCASCALAVAGIGCGLYLALILHLPAPAGVWACRRGEAIQLATLLQHHAGSLPSWSLGLPAWRAPALPPQCRRTRSCLHRIGQCTISNFPSRRAAAGLRRFAAAFCTISPATPATVTSCKFATSRNSTP